MYKTVTIIILSIVLAGLLPTTIWLAIERNSKGSEIEQLTEKVEDYKSKTEMLYKRIKRVAMASCLMEGYELTKTSTVDTCRVNVNFIIDNKTDADLDELLMPLGY